MAEAGVNIDIEFLVQNVGHGGSTDMSFTVPRVELARAKKVLVREMNARELTTDASVGKVSIVGAGLHNAPATRRACSVRSPMPAVNIEIDLHLGGA